MFARRKIGFYLLGIALVAVFACASDDVVEVMIPPRIDLSLYGTIGIIEFSSENVGDLGPLASQQFMAALQSAQPGTPILELGNEARVLRAVQRHDLDPEAIQAIGEKYRVDAILVGNLDAKSVKPGLSIDSLMRSLSANAYIEASLSTKIFEAGSGATIWTNVARSREDVAHLDLASHSLPSLGATNADEVHQKLVRGLVEQATADFWPRYARQ